MKRMSLPSAYRVPFYVPSGWRISKVTLTIMDPFDGIRKLIDTSFGKACSYESFKNKGTEAPVYLHQHWEGFQGHGHGPGVISLLVYREGTNHIIIMMSSPSLNQGHTIQGSMSKF